MIRSVEASIPVRPLNPGGIATKIEHREPKYAYGTYRTGKGVGFDALWIVPAATGADAARIHDYCLHSLIYLCLYKGNRDI
jgi:hypothetical protein